MPVIRILPHPEYCPQGDTIEAAPGTSLCEAMLENGIAIEHACEMSCACTTCHVIVREGFDSLGEMDESEDDLLDRAWGLSPPSGLRPRLAFTPFSHSSVFSGPQWAIAAEISARL